MSSGGSDASSRDVPARDTPRTPVTHPVRVLIVGATSEPWEAIADEVERDLAGLRRDGVDVEYRCTGAGPASIRDDADAARAAPHVVDAVIAAAADGFDAVIVDCTSDPGVAEARRAVAIPVIGPGEAVRAALTDAAAPVCELSGDELRAVGADGALERARGAATVVLGGTGFSHIAAALRDDDPDRAVLDPLAVALDAAVAASSRRRSTG